MPVISFANSKGGSGKTTGALVLACELAQSRPVTIVDADPRHPIARWAELPGKPDNLTVIVNETEESVVDQIDDAASNDPFVIVDLEGVGSRRVTYAIGLSDLVIIPMKEQQQDALAALDVIREIANAGKVSRPRREIPFSVLFTQSRVIAKPRTARHIADQFRSESRIDTFDTELHDRDAFAAIYTTGGTVRDLKSSDVNNTDKAIENAAVYTAEVIYKLRSLNGARSREVA